METMSPPGILHAQHLIVQTLHTQTSRFHPPRSSKTSLDTIHSNTLHPHHLYSIAHNRQSTAIIPPLLPISHTFLQHINSQPISILPVMALLRNRPRISSLRRLHRRHLLAHMNRPVLPNLPLPPNCHRYLIVNNRQLYRRELVVALHKHIRLLHPHHLLSPL